MNTELNNLFPFLPNFLLPLASIDEVITIY